MTKKYSTENDVVSYKWVKIIQSFLLIVFGVVLCIFSKSTDIQNALGYITASIILLYGILTIGFGLIFAKGILSIENVSGAALIALSVLIYVNPNIVMEYIPVFSGTMLCSLGCIFLVETFIAFISKRISSGILYLISTLIFCGLGITTIVLNYSSNESNQAFIKGLLIILIGCILILGGLIMIFYYAANPKFKINKQEIISEDGTKKFTVIETERKIVKEKKSKTKKAKKVETKDLDNDSSKDGEIIPIDSDSK